MNKQYFFKIVIVLCIITFTQIRVNGQKLKDFQCDYGWYVLPENSNYSINCFVDLCTKSYNFSDRDSLFWEVIDLNRDSTLSINQNVYRLKHLFNGIEVENSQITFFEKDGYVQFAYGELYDGIHLDINISIPKISDNLSLENAKKVIEGEYAWNNSKVENYLKELTEDSTATFSPLASNILIKKIDTTYHLVNQWTICTIDTLNGIDEYIVDVDAFSGNVINVNKEIFNSIGNCENAEVITLYYGKQYDMKTKHIAPWVYGLKNCNKLATTDFINLTRYTFGQTSFLVDSDNIWTSVEERPATTAHWAACKIQNYFINKCSLGGRPIQLIVNSTKHNNAYYSIDYFSSISGRNSYNKIEIGISDRGNYYSTVDIIAHEYGHGIIRHTSNLDNKGESGAINESFADIFAILAENHILGRNDWTIGEDVGEILRDVKNPICDYYLGTNWVNTSDVSSSNDNGGIHTNSGVQNRWFFLVASEIGLNKAGKLAFATQKILNRTSKYRDVRNLSIILAENLWGRCSEEYNAVVEAWYEVGVSLRNATWYCSNGHHIMPNMFLPKFVDCSLNNTISIYPNPVGNLLFVDLPQKATVCIVDVNGQTLHAYELDKGRHSIDVSNLISGVYFVRCNNEVEKIVKIK